MQASNLQFPSAPSAAGAREVPPLPHPGAKRLPRRAGGAATRGLPAENPLLLGQKPSLLAQSQHFILEETRCSRSPAPGTAPTHPVLGNLCEQVTGAHTEEPPERPPRPPGCQQPNFGTPVPPPGAPLPSRVPLRRGAAVPARCRAAPLTSPAARSPPLPGRRYPSPRAARP